MHIASFSVSALIFVVWQTPEGQLRRRGSRQVVFLGCLASLTLSKKFSSALSCRLWESLDLLSTLPLFWFVSSEHQQD